jgi:hypothetical protein
LVRRGNLVFENVLHHRKVYARPVELSVTDNPVQQPLERVYRACQKVECETVAPALVERCPLEDRPKMPRITSDRCCPCRTCKRYEVV